MSSTPTPTPAPGTPAAVYTTDETTAQQTWLGPMIGAQIAAFGQANQMYEEAGGFLHDLTPSELTRLTSMLAALPGRPRFLRYSAALFPQRGVTADGKNLVEHYTTAGLAVAGATQVITTVSQNAQIAAYLTNAGYEGINFEYFSPGPYWKANGALAAGKIGSPTKNSDNPTVDPTYWNWIDDFTDAIIVDVQYAAEKTGKPISLFSLQNEPSSTASTYSHCDYIGKEQAYVDTLRVLIPKLLAATIPNTTSADIRIHADSWDGYSGTIGTIIRTGTRDCITLNMTPGSETKTPAGYNIIDKMWAWSVHKISTYAADANSIGFNEDTGLPAFDSEFEHFDTDRTSHLATYAPNGEKWMFCNLALVIVNTIRRWNAATCNAPIHLMKPTYDGVGNLGFAALEWKAPVTTNITNNANATGDSAFDSLGVGEWTYNKRNWNAARGLYKHLPHNAVRYNATLTSGATTGDQSWMVFKSGNQWIWCYVNRASSTFTFKHSISADRDFLIYTYDIDSDPTGPTPTLTQATAAGGLVVDVPAFSVVWAVQSGGDMTSPTITSGNTLSVAENSTLAHTLTANETVTWSIVGGADQAKFEISGSTLRWASNGTKNYEAPDDANGDNAYVVTIRATDSAGNVSANQMITVTVTDVAESSYEPESETYFAAMSVAPDDTRKAHINTLIAGLKTDGVWAKLEALYLLGAHDAQAARLNAKSPTGTAATAVGSPTFTADQGYTTNGTTSEIDTGFNTSTATLFLQDSCYFGIYVRSNDAAAASASAGWFDGTDGTTLNARDASDKVTGRANQAAALVSTPTVPTTEGLTSVARNGATSMAVRKNGVSLTGAANVSVARNNATLRLGRASSAGYRGHQFFAAAAGGFLTATEDLALYNRLTTYRSAIGA